MENFKDKQEPHFDIVRNGTGLVAIAPSPSGAQSPETDILLTLESLLYHLESTLKEVDCSGILYHSPFLSNEPDYRNLLAETTGTVDFEERLTRLLERALAIKRQEKPVIGLFKGSCSGLALAAMLWATHRIALQGTSLSFPEAHYGLFPGFGATVFTSTIIGSDKAIPLLTQGRAIGEGAALAIGLVDAIAESPEAARIQATEIINQGAKSLAGRQPTHFDEQALETAAAAVTKKTRGLNTGINLCLDVVQQTQLLPISTVLQLEAQHYIKAWQSPIVIPMLRTQYYGVREAAQPKAESRSLDYTPQKIGVLGAGMMGSGIAFEAARAGLYVVLKDIDITQAIRGKGYAEQISAKLVEQGRLSADKREQLLSRIQPSGKMEDLTDSDLIIEAVFEDRELKAKVTRESLPYLHENGIYASNTTSLPITELAAVSSQPEAFIGMHFFSPVDRMALVEVIRGEKTDEKTLQKTVKIIHMLGKIPIVVNDGPAFFTSRIFFNYLLEAITMMLEGIPASWIEEEAFAAGFGAGPLAVLDEISLPLMTHVYDQLPRLHSSQQRCYDYLHTLIDEGRAGRKSGKGFYDYNPNTGKKMIWQDPRIEVAASMPARETIRQRLLHVVALDSYRCLDEGILNRAIDGDIGSILGIGYPAHTGGVFGHIDQVGLRRFLRECTAFRAHGEQWEIPTSLIVRMDRNLSFYSGFEAN